MGIFNLSLAKSESAPATAEPVAQTQDAPGVVVPLDNTPSNVGKDDSAQATVVLDGPLSHVYTQALNIVYAKEGMMTMLNVQSGDSKGQKGTYVYAMPNDIKVEDVASLTGKLNLVIAGKKYKDVVLVLESDNGSTKASQLLDDYARSVGAQVIYRRSLGLKKIQAALESAVHT